jgi:hypothetical protein
MHWIRSHLSFANSISMIALFVALGGTSIAAVSLSKNSVGSKQVKKNSLKAADIARNAVGASEIRPSSVRGGDVGDGSIGSLDIGDNAVGGGELADNSVGSGEIGSGAVGSDEAADDSLTGTDIDESTLSIPAGAEFFARVQADGTLQPNVAGFPPQNKGLENANVVKGEGGAATGTYCFDTPQRIASALVSLDNADAAAADRNLVTSVAIDRGEDLGDCPATHNDARIRVVDGSTAAAQDARFFVWFDA